MARKKRRKRSRLLVRHAQPRNRPNQARPTSFASSSLPRARPKGRRRPRPPHRSSPPGRPCSRAAPLLGPKPIRSLLRIPAPGRGLLIRPADEPSAPRHRGASSAPGRGVGQSHPAPSALFLRTWPPRVPGWVSSQPNRPARRARPTASAGPFSFGAWCWAGLPGRSLRSPRPGRFPSAPSRCQGHAEGGWLGSFGCCSFLRPNRKPLALFVRSTPG